MDTGNLFFIVFMVFVIVMLSLDLGVFHKKDHVVGIKEAAIWTGIWIGLAMIFAIVIRFHAEWIHGMTMADFGSVAELNAYRKEMMSQFLAG